MAISEPRPLLDRPFLDTNVIFSGLYSSRGAPAEILRRHADGQLTMVVSDQVLQELTATIQNKAPHLAPLLQSFLAQVPPEIAADPSPAIVQWAGALIDADDAPILAAAMECQADCLVTGNTRHFTDAVAQAAGILILAPAAYLARLTGGATC